MRRGLENPAFIGVSYLPFAFGHRASLRRRLCLPILQSCVKCFPAVPVLQLPFCTIAGNVFWRKHVYVVCSAVYLQIKCLLCCKSPKFRLLPALSGGYLRQRVVSSRDKGVTSGAEWHWHVGPKMRLQISFEVLISLAITFAVLAMLVGGFAALRYHTISYSSAVSNSIFRAYAAIAGFESQEMCFEYQNVIT